MVSEAHSSFMIPWTLTETSEAPNNMIISSYLTPSLAVMILMTVSLRELHLPAYHV